MACASALMMMVLMIFTDLYSFLGATKGYKLSSAYWGWEWLLDYLHGFGYAVNTVVSM